MRTKISTLAIALAMVSSQALANQDTVDELVAAGVTLTEAQTTAIAAAEGQDLLDEIAALVAAAGDNATLVSAIVSAAVRANPSLSGDIETTAKANAPSSLASAISDAVSTALAAVNTPGGGDSTTTEQAVTNTPTDTGGGGSGSPS